MHGAATRLQSPVAHALQPQSGKKLLVELFKMLVLRSIHSGALSGEPAPGADTASCCARAGYKVAA
jgi:hypothetical protein